RRAHDYQQYEGGDDERGDMFRAMGAGAPQGGRTPYALRAHARYQGRDRLEQPTPGAFAQLGRRRGWSRRGPHDRASSLAAKPSASWPTAVLIAVTSPGTSVAGGVTTKRKLRSAGPLRPLKLTLACACRTRLPAASSSSRCMLSSIVASGEAVTAP